MYSLKELSETASKTELSSSLDAYFSMLHTISLVSFLICCFLQTVLLKYLWIRVVSLLHVLFVLLDGNIFVTCKVHT